MSTAVRVILWFTCAFLIAQLCGHDGDFTLAPENAVPRIPAGLMDEAARLEGQWAGQMAKIEGSGAVTAMVKSQMVDISTVRPSPTRLFADPIKLARHGEFNMTRCDPITLVKKDGVLTISDGMTRVQNAKIPE